MCITFISEQVHIVSSSKEKAEEKEKASSMRAALEQQMDQLRDVHHKQVIFISFFY